jgi:hypothetical protein
VSNFEPVTNRLVPARVWEAPISIANLAAARRASCEQPNEPALTLLVMHATSGGVGSGFGNVVVSEDSGTVEDLAALER